MQCYLLAGSCIHSIASWLIAVAIYSLFDFICKRVISHSLLHKILTKVSVNIPREKLKYLLEMKLKLKVSWILPLVLDFQYLQIKIIFIIFVFLTFQLHKNYLRCVVKDLEDMWSIQLKNNTQKQFHPSLQPILYKMRT